MTSKWLTLQLHVVIHFTPCNRMPNKNNEEGENSDTFEALGRSIWYEFWCV